MSIKKNQNAFTLIELIFVMAIMGLVGVVIIPSLGSFLETGNIRTAARKVQADLRYAQSLASTTGDSYGFRATSSTEYEIYDVSTGSAVDSPYDLQPMQVNLNEISSQLVFTASTYPAYQVTFDSSGSPSSATTIELSDTSGSVSNLEVVTSSNGLIQIQ